MKPINNSLFITSQTDTILANCYHAFTKQNNIFWALTEYCSWQLREGRDL